MEGAAAGHDGGGGERAHPWARYVNPVLAGLYAAAGLDKRFVRAEGAHLEDATGRRYLDFLSGYGSVPLGHHPDALWEVVRAVERSREPVFSIPALLDGAGLLAETLVQAATATSDDDGEDEQAVRLRYAMFANSGSEAVEWAIKLARTRTQRLGVLSTWNSYHGKTLGALSASGRTQYHGLAAPAEGVHAKQERVRERAHSHVVMCDLSIRIRVRRLWRRGGSALQVRGSAGQGRSVRRLPRGAHSRRRRCVCALAIRMRPLIALSLSLSIPLTSC
jgi:4-aminobutyrate aminotransferase-like enzyme